MIYFKNEVIYKLEFVINFYKIIGSTTKNLT